MFKNEKATITIRNIFGGIGGSFQYKLNNDNFTSCSDPQVITINEIKQETIVKLIVADKNGCESEPAIIAIPCPEEFDCKLEKTKGILCYNQPEAELKLTISGINNIVAIPFDITLMKGQEEYFKKTLYYDNPITFPNSETGKIGAGEYEATVSYTLDGKTYTKSSTVTIDDKDELHINVNAKPVICGYTNEKTGSASIEALGGTSPYFYSSDNGQTYQSSPVFPNLESKTYQFMVKDFLGCYTKPTDISVGVPKNMLELSIDVLASCTGGGANGSLKLSPSGGTLPYTIQLTNDEGKYFKAIEDESGLKTIFPNLPSDTYYGELTDSNGCYVKINRNLSGIEQLKITVESIKNPLCSDNTSGEINISVKGGVQFNTNDMPYNVYYKKDNSEVNFSYNNGIFTSDHLYGGYYEIFVTDKSGETTSEIVNVQAPEKLQLDNFTINGNSEIGVSDGSVTWNKVSGGTSPYIVSLDNENIAGNRKDGLVNGDYTILISDNNDCKATKDFTIHVKQINVSIKKVFINCKYTLKAIANYGIGNFNYHWYIKNGEVFDPITEWDGNNMINAEEGKNYRVVVTDDSEKSGDAESGTLDFISKPILEAQSLVYVSCKGGNNGKIITSFTNANGNSTYFWINKATGGSISDGTSATISGLAAGEYRVFAIDDAGCSDSKTFEIKEPSRELIVTDNINKLTNGNIDISVNHIWDYFEQTSLVWTDHFGNVIETYNRDKNDTNESFSLTNQGTGTFKLKVNETIQSGNISSEGCTVEKSYSTGNSIDIEKSGYLGCAENPEDGISISASVFGPDAQGKTFIYQLEKTEGSGQKYYTADNNTFNSLGIGKYLITATTDGSSTAISKSFSIEAPAQLKWETSVKPACQGLSNGTIAIIPNGGSGNYQYLWPDLSTGQSHDNLAPGSYEVKLTDSQHCTKTFNVNIPEDNDFTINLDSKILPSDYSSVNGLLNISVSGGIPPFSYKWYNSDGKLIKETEDLTNVGYGDYTLKVNDASGCQEKTQTFNFGLAPLTINLSIGNNIICDYDQNGILNVAIAGGEKYSTEPGYIINWSKYDAVSAQWKAITCTDPVLKNCSAGRYQVSVTDKNNVSEIREVTLIPASSKITVSASVTNALCNGNLGSIATNITGGVVPYQFRWSTGATTQSIDKLSKGAYNITVTDAKGCIVSKGFSIDQSGELDYLATVIDPDCKNPYNGKISLEIKNQEGDYEYKWIGTDKKGSVVDNLLQGDYSVVVSLKNTGCYLLKDFELKEPVAPAEMTLVPNNLVLCDKQDKTLTIPQNNLFDYQWRFADKLVKGKSVDIRSEEIGSAGIDYTFDMIKNNPDDACTWSKSFHVTTSSLKVDAGFLAATIVQAGDTVYIVNSKNNVDKDITWTFPNEAKLISESPNVNALQFQAKEGEEYTDYKVYLRVANGECYIDAEKLIRVHNTPVSKSPLIYSEPLIKSVIASPNPSYGNLNLEVVLDKATNFFVRIFSSGTGYFLLDQEYFANSLTDYPDNDYLFKKDFCIAAPKGIYVIMVIAPNGETRYVKIEVK